MKHGSFGRLAAQNGGVAYWCACPGWHGAGLSLSAAEAASRWGAEATVDDIRRRLRCRWCGHRGPRIIADVWQRGPERPLS